MNFTANDIAVGYNGNSVLETDALNVQSGKVYFLIGRNGAGKTTLLKSFCGLLPLINGQLRLNNNSLEDLSIHEKSKLFTFVRSSAHRVDHMKVWDYVAYGRMPYTGLLGRLNKEDVNIIDRSLEQLGITDLSGRYLTRLSDGEFRKVQIAMALCQQTELLFIDEPTAHLDIAAKAELFHLFQKMAREMGKAMVISTHEVHAALEMSDKLWLINKGYLHSGLAKEMLASGMVDEVFGSDLVSFRKEGKIKIMKVV
ncbi:MAG: ABC transporter ATP-binding protein [Flavobacteriales bacterium]|nr:ABC transporter ATP-binding protein [Flavobacteriales bacterium]